MCPIGAAAEISQAGSSCRGAEARSAGNGAIEHRGEGRDGGDAQDYDTDQNYPASPTVTGTSETVGDLARLFDLAHRSERAVCALRQPLPHVLGRAIGPAVLIHNASIVRRSTSSGAPCSMRRRPRDWGIAPITLEPSELHL
jgi:hypothetical protein